MAPKTRSIPAGKTPATPTGKTPSSDFHKRVIRLVAGIIITTALAIVLRDSWWTGFCQTMSQRALRQRDLTAAMSWLDSVTWMARDNSETALLRARILRKTGRLNELNPALELARDLKAAPDRILLEQWLALAQSGQMSEAEPHLAQLLTQPDVDLEEVCEAYVLGYIRTLNFAAAHRLLELWVADFPQSVMPHMLRGKTASVSDDPKLAEQEFRAALQLDSQHAESRMMLAKVLREQNRPEEAMALLAGLEDNQELRPRVLFERALCQRMTSEPEQVTQLLSEVVRLAPEDPKAWLELGRTHLEANRASEAAEALQRAVQLAPRDDEAHYVLGLALQAQGKTDDAAKHFQFREDARNAQRNLGNLRERIHRNPKDSEALIELGEIMLRYGSPDEGVVRLLAALDLDAGNQRARKLLVDYYSELSVSDPAFKRLADEHRQWLRPEVPPVPNVSEPQKPSEKSQP